MKVRCLFRSQTPLTMPRRRSVLASASVNERESLPALDRQNMNPEVEIRIARSASEVEALREPWTAWGGERDSDIDFVLMIIESYPEAVRPHVIALYRNGEPEAILIGRLERKRLDFRIGYLTVFRPWARCLTFVCGALRGNASQENTRMLLSEVMHCLKEDEADLAVLEFVSTQSSLYQLGLKMPGILSRDVLPALQKRHLLSLPKDVEEVYGRMSGTRRKHLRSSERKLQEHPAGALRIVCYRDPSEFERLFRDAESIAQKTYQRGLGAGFSDTPLVRARLGLAARKGWLRANLLYIGDRPVAFWIGVIYGRTFGSEYMGYDPEFRQFSPGMFLVMRVIEGLCSGASGDAVSELNFGPGDAEYKAMLSTRSSLEGSIFIFSPKMKGIFLKLLRTATRAVDVMARKTFGSARLVPKLKRLWRDRLSRRAGTASQGAKALN